MRLNDWLLSELDLEGAYTRKHLERVPMDQLEFKPHDKSMTLGWLTTFLAVIPTWGGFTLTGDNFDAAPEGSQPPKQEVVRSSNELLTLFDGNVADVRAALSRASDEHLAAPWSLLPTGKTIFTQPRFLVFETYFLNHMVHHRAQLGVYLRLLGVAVPAVYSGSADEQGGIFVSPP
jgi:uncharacterized damage-inducible protein DinB